MSFEQTVLAIETATRHTSLAILRGSKICAEWRGNADFSPSENLLAEISELLRTANIKSSELNLLATLNGPGSFTGLRVGLSLAKGLAAAWKIPVIGVSTFEAMIYGHLNDNNILTVLPAGRHEIFIQKFTGNFQVEPLKTISLNELLGDISSSQIALIISTPDLSGEITGILAAHLSADKPRLEISRNLAVNLGQIALENARQNLSPTELPQLDYGRGAIVAGKRQ